MVYLTSQYINLHAVPFIKRNYAAYKLKFLKILRMLSRRLYRSRICPCLINGVYVQMVFRRLELHNIVPPEKLPYLVPEEGRSILFDYQQVNLQRLCVQVVFFFK